MTTIAPDILKRITERRQDLITNANELASRWFENDTEYKHKRRFYAPHVRITNAGAENESASIYWTRRYPVNNWTGIEIEKRTGQKKTLRVASKYIPAARDGAAYPPKKFPDAQEDELRDITDLEAMLAPIREELAFLGRMRRSFTDFYARRGALTRPEDASPEGPERQDESLPEW